NDVEEGENARFGAVDDALLEVFEVPPAGAAGVDYRGNANAEGKAVGRHAVVAGVGAALAGSRVDMNVDIDQAGRNIHTLDVDGLERIRGGDVIGYFGDLAILDGDIHDRVDMVPVIEDMAAFEQQIVDRSGRGLRLCATVQA